MAIQPIQPLYAKKTENRYNLNKGQTPTVQANPLIQNQSTQQVKPAEPANTGTGFTNINRILDANKRNRLGSTIGSNLSSVASGVKTDLQKQREMFEKQQQEAVSKFDPTKRQDIIDRVTAAPAQPVSQSGVSNTTGQSGVSPVLSQQQQQEAYNLEQAKQRQVTDKDIEDFKLFREGKYTGPMELSESDKLLARGQEAQGLAGLTRGSAGQKELLNKYVGGNQYSRGERTLDSILLGRTGQKDLAKARAENVGITSNIEKARRAAEAKATENVAKAQQFGVETKGILEGKTAEAQQQINKQHEQRIAEANEQYNKLKTMLQKVDEEEDLAKRYKLTNEDFASLGVDTSTEEGKTLAAQLQAVFGLSNRDIAKNVQLQYRAPKTAQEIREAMKSSGGYHHAAKSGMQWAADEYGQAASQAENYLVNKANIEKQIEHAKTIGENTENLKKQLNNLDESLARNPYAQQYVSGQFSGSILDKFNPYKTGTMQSGMSAFSDYEQGQALSDDMMKSLGISDATIKSIKKERLENKQWENLLSPDIVNTSGVATVGRESTASAEQLARANALARLQGQVPLYTDEQIKAADRRGKTAFDVEKAKQFITGVNFDEDQQIQFDDPGLADLLSGMGEEWGTKWGEFGANQMYTPYGKAALDKIGLGKPLGELTGGIWGGAGEFAGTLAEDITDVAGTVICTELARQHYISPEIMAKDAEFGLKLRATDPYAYLGYRAWADHVVKLMQKSNTITKIVNFIAQPWVRYMAGEGNFIGKAMSKIGIPVCRMIGKLFYV